MATPAQDMADLQRMMKSFIEAQSQHTKQTIRAHKATQGVNDALEVYESSLNSTTKLSDKQLELQKKAMDAKQKELQLYHKSLQQQRIIADTEAKISAAGSNASQSLIDSLAAQQQLLSAINTNQSVAAAKSVKAHDAYAKSFVGMSGIMNKFNAGVSNAIGGIGSFGGGLLGATGKLGMFGTVISLVLDQAFKALDQTKKVMVASGGVFEGATAAEGLVNQTMEGAKRFIADPAVMARIASESRLVTNAMGGLHNSMLQLDNVANDLYQSTGDFGEAQRQAAQIALQFATKGVFPAQDALDQYRKDMTMQNEINGMSLEQSRALYDSVAGDISTTTLLKRAKMGERQAILDNQRALMQSNQSLGMTADQAGEAAKMLGKMVAEKPLDRLRKAARIQAYGAAMGLGPEAAAAAAAIRKGSRASEAEKKQANDFFVAATNLQDSMAMQGATQEILSTQLADKLGLEQLVGPESPFSTTLGNIIAKPLEETKAMFSEANKTMVTDALKLKDVGEASIAMIKNGTLAILGIWKSADALTRYLDQHDITFKSVGDSLMLFGQQSLNAVMAPFQALAGGFNYLLSSIAEIVEKITGFLGMTSVSEKAKNSSIELYKNAMGYFNQIATNVSSAWGGEKDKNVSMPITIAEDNSKKESADVIKENQTKSAAIQGVETNLKLLEATEKQHSTFSNQLLKLDESATFLKTIADTQPVLVDLAQKQLAAMTMTETQRQKYASGLSRSSSKFAAEYATVE